MLLQERNDIENSESSFYLKKMVVLLEDSEDVQNVIKEVIEDEFKGHLEVVKNKEEVVEASKKKQADFFILDNYVGQNRHEGLDALEQVRLENETAFIAIFSAYPNYKEQALNLGCNLFVEKSPDLRSCVHYIAREMIQYCFEFSMRKANLAIFSRRTTEQIELSPNSKSRRNPKLNKDCNIEQYKKLKSDQGWFRKNQGKYAVFVDGEWVRSSKDDTDKSRKDLLNWLISEKKYSDKQRLVIKVEIDFEVIDEPSSLWFD